MVVVQFPFDLLLLLLNPFLSFEISFLSFIPLSLTFFFPFNIDSRVPSYLLCLFTLLSVVNPKL